jgi:LysR family transcriptional regulator, glycine cleavage system transcriptional activator
MNRRLIPSISALQAFDASVRHLNFTRAATELHLTQGAVSRQIRELEETLGQSLFAREGKGLTLTESGLHYHHLIRPCLEALQSATLELLSHRGEGGVLNVSVPPTFAARWLIPRMPALIATAPQLTINFVPYVKQLDFSQRNHDVGIRFGDGNWAHVKSEYIIGKEVVPVASPTLVKAGAYNKHPHKLARHTLLQHVSVPDAWPEWFAARGIEGVLGAGGPRFDQFSQLTQAASAGMGVALVPLFLAREELQSGQLVIPVEGAFESSRAFHLVYPAERQTMPRFKLFRDWLVTQQP